MSNPHPLPPIQRSEIVAATIKDNSRLFDIDGFNELTNDLRILCYEHVKNPELGKTELSRKTGIDKRTVYRFFASKTWEEINNELARQQLRELIQLAIRTLRKNMLTGTSAVQVDAATKVLVSSKLLRGGNPEIGKQDNKIVVVWDKEKNFGNQDTVSASLAPEGGSQ